MKNTKAKFYVLVISVGLFWNCDETVVPKLVCSQPDFVVNKSVEAIQIMRSYCY
jgi:hypothetical protein